MPQKKTRVNPTRTLNPLHFEDLEPHRFEDLVRQLVYDFRNWSSLEPTGRLGSDEGYDARGTEIVEGLLPPSDDEEGEDKSTAGTEERLWQIQCKRERSVSPKKIATYINQMIPTGATTPYGVIFAAPADFSKKTRDIFRETLRQKGAREFYLWGKADIEDALYQPTNDHLLYAYFGISLQIQKRSQRSALRSILSIKRKAINHLGAIDQRSFKDILIRDIDDTHYPFSEELADFAQNPPWRTFYFLGHAHDGIRVLAKRYFAYRDVEYLPPDGRAILKGWDFTKQGSLKARDSWEETGDDDRHYAVYTFWQNLEKQKQAHFEIVGRIKYENIIDIDPAGDVYAQCPHVYVKRVTNLSFFERNLSYKLVPADGWGGQETYLPVNAEELRKKIFPDHFADPPPSGGPTENLGTSS
jgi:hypothetical protein